VTLNLSALSQQLQQMGATLAGRQQALSDLLKEAQDVLRRQADDLDRLADWARRAAKDCSWRVAIPAGQPLDCAYPEPPHPDRATLIAVDGSPVEPDPHSVALFYLINLGSIVFEHGSDRRPLASSEPELGYSDEDLYEQDRLVQGNLLDVRMATAEMSKLAELAAQHPGAPLAALRDGPLLLWILEENPPTRPQAKLERYLANLGALQRQGAALAGVIDRPLYSDVINLIYLATRQDPPTRREDVVGHRYRRLVDAALFGFLAPGERSALFISSGKVNEDHRRQSPAFEILFFYLNVGTEGHAEILRVEIPRWVAERPAPWQPEGAPRAYLLVDFVQAAICQQCRIARPFPYVLGRAHELALVSVEERRELEMRAVAAMARQGMVGQPSEKARLKELTGSRRAGPPRRR